MAITNILYQPKIWSAAYNPIMWSVNSNQITQPDFKYVFDVFVNAATGTTGPSTYRIKQRPNPSGVGMIDVSTLVQPFIELTNWSAEKGWNNIFRNSSDITPSVFIRVGEEWNVNGTPVIFNGSGVTGPPSFFLGPTGIGSPGSANITTQPVRCLPASLPFEIQTTIMSDYSDFNSFWKDYVMDGNGKFLTTQTGARKLRRNDRHTISFLNQWDAATVNRSQSILLIQARTFDANGVQLGNLNVYNTGPSGGGPQTSTAYTTITPTRETSMLTFKCGPQELGLGSNVARYEIRAFYKETTSIDPNYLASEKLDFEISEDCQELYQNVRLSFLNNLGGRDYYNFTTFYEKTTSSKFDTYNQYSLNYSGSTPVVSSTATNSTQNWLRGGDKIYNKVTETTFEIQSDWLTQEEVDFLAQIPESPSVWAYIGDNDIPVTIVITDTNYTYKNVMQTKLVQATFQCRMTKNQIKQY